MKDPNRNLDTVKDAEAFMSGKEDSLSDGVSEILKGALSSPHPAPNELVTAVSNQHRVTAFPDMVRGANKTLQEAADKEISTLDDRIQTAKDKHDQEMKVLTDKKQEYMNVRAQIVDLMHNLEGN